MIATDWPHQLKGVADTLAAIKAGQRRIVLTSPTGAGKTRIAQRLIEHWTQHEVRRVVLYTNRRMLLDQLAEVLTKADISFGVRAAGHEPDLGKMVQIASMQTEHARRGKQGMFPAQRVICDEAHLQTGPTAQAIFAAHLEDNAAMVGLTATPLGLGEMYDHLIVAGTNSGLRDCGALVPCVHYGPDEPDLRKLKGLREGEDLSESQQRKAMKSPTLWARVLEWFERLNPEHKPSILFAPGVPESLWFAQQFTAAGIPAAHIDGQEVWFDGFFYKSDKGIRDDVLNHSRDGRCPVICNRYVLREGIDAPWLSHGVLATVFGSLQSYLQSGGRLLRAFPGNSAVTIQDHGGNWHRHGSLNADREWFLDATGSILSGLRAERLRSKVEREPYRCPQCAKILLGSRCTCGYERKGKASRPVVQTDGTLKEMVGDIYRPRRICGKTNGPTLWKRMYYRSCTEKGARTFAAAAALFASENDFGWPDKHWPLMPRDPIDNFRLVSDVPRERLNPE